MCANIPKAETQHRCVIWLQKYFETHSDASPDQDFSKVSLVHRKDLFQHYKKEMKKSNLSKVKYSRFICGFS